MSGSVLRLATRASPLALFQAELVAQRLRVVAPLLGVELVVVDTSGDRRGDVPIHALDERGVFVVEVEAAVLDGRADVAVHSAKDLPAGAPPEGLVLASVPDRDDPRDALVGRNLAELDPGATVATGSIRRRAQIAALRPDLHFRELRGNIATRLERVPTGGAIVVAYAALRRLGLELHASEVLEPAVMLPQVGQGALALRCREHDERTLELLRVIDDSGAHRCVRAERAFLARLGGGCDAPVGAYATLTELALPEGEIEIDALVARPDGALVLRRQGRGRDPELLGLQIAEQLLAAGGGALLGGSTAT